MFIEECKQDANRFEQPIKKEKLTTFRDECAKNHRSTNNKVATLKCTRDLMGRLAIIAARRKLDLKFVFQYPLTPVPLSMFSSDGLMAKTNKAALLKELEKRAKKSHPKTVDACIIDSNYLLHMLPPNLPSTYGGVAKTILQQAVALSRKRIDILFDTYSKPSIKDCERMRRGTEPRDYIITGS